MAKGDEHRSPSFARTGAPTPTDAVTKKRGRSCRGYASGLEISDSLYQVS